MKLSDLINRKPRGKKGEGRQVHFVTINIPKDVADDLKLYRDLYSISLSKTKDENGYPIPEKVSFENMLRRWLDNIGTFDPEIKQLFDDAKLSRRKEMEKEAAALGLSPEQLKANQAAYDPTNPEDEPWKLKYIFEKDGEEIEAHPGNKAAFYAKINGRNVGIKTMLADGWTLMNENGVEIDIDQAWQINILIKVHSSEQDSPTSK